MEQKPLIETNPYLRDPEKFRKALVTSVASSTSIETGAPVLHQSLACWKKASSASPSRRSKALLDNLRE